MQFSAEQIAQLVTGSIEGRTDRNVSSFAKIEEASENDLAFLANPKYEEYLYTTKAGIIIIGSDLQLKQPVLGTLIRVKDPYSSFASLMQFYQQMVSQQLSGIEEPSFIHPTASIGNHVFIGAFAYIAEGAVIEDGAKIHPQAYVGRNSRIGNGSIIFPGVKIYHDCVIGNSVTLHAGVVIGSDGFGFAPQADGTYQKVPQMGNVVIEDEVEIGANTCIDRATMGSTIIRKGTKLDNLIQIAHNTEVGEHSVIAAQTGISGSTKIGKRVMVGGQVGVAGHISVADGTKVGAQSGITKTVRFPNTTINGTPAHDYTSSMRSQAVLRRLPDLEKKINELENLLKALIKERDQISSGS
jgi:UDP-3-O-[3-hydroxymyristoyl] glucosamine N-acyltransferase